MLSAVDDNHWRILYWWVRWSITVTFTDFTSIISFKVILYSHSCGHYSHSSNKSPNAGAYHCSPEPLNKTFKSLKFRFLLKYNFDHLSFPFSGSSLAKGYVILFLSLTVKAPYFCPLSYFTLQLGWQMTWTPMHFLYVQLLSLPVIFLTLSWALILFTMCSNSLYAYKCNPNAHKIFGWLKPDIVSFPLPCIITLSIS